MGAAPAVANRPRRQRPRLGPGGTDHRAPQPERPGSALAAVPRATGRGLGLPPPGVYPLHALALVLGLLFVAGAVVVFVLHASGHILLTPYLALCLILAVVNGAYG